MRHVVAALLLAVAPVVLMWTLCFVLLVMGDPKAAVGFFADFTGHLGTGELKGQRITEMSLIGIAMAAPIAFAWSHFRSGNKILMYVVCPVCLAFVSALGHYGTTVNNEWPNVVLVGGAFVAFIGGVIASIYDALAKKKVWPFYEEPVLPSQLR